MDNHKLWEVVLGELEVSLTKANFTTWFKDTFVSDITKEGEAIISAPSVFVREWLKNKYSEEILAILKKHLPSVKKISFKIGQQALSKTLGRPAKTVTVGSSGLVADAEQTVKTSSLNQKYVFDAFVVGGSNKLAHAAAMAVGQNPGKTYNPLFLYGGAGLGKTHLMQATGNEILKHFPKKKVLYVSCENFCNEFIMAIRSGKINSFKKTYRGTDVLLIDDVQFLAGKESTQEEFFHTFNYLYQLNKQVVLTSDRPPKAIATLEDRLKSRFEWGMIADIALPDFETRKAILESKAKEKGLVLDQEVIDYVAMNVQRNIRELEGALNRLMAYAELENRAIEISLAKSALTELVRPQIKSLNPDKILDTVCAYYSTTRETLFSSKRNKELVAPRQIIMYLLRIEMNYSYPKIAEILGKKDHTTIMHGFNKIEKEAQSNPVIQSDLSKLKEALYSY
jgi:chromosomal replication initiator protein